MKRPLVLAISLFAATACMSRATQPPPASGEAPAAPPAATSASPAATASATPNAMSTATPGPNPATAATATATGNALFVIEDVFTIAGVGVVATGKVRRGSIKVGDELELLGFRDAKRVTVKSIESFRKMTGVAAAGTEAGIALKGVEKGEVERGQVLATPGSMKTGTKMTADIEIAATRPTPVKNGYRPQLQLHASAVTGTLTLASEIAPGGKGRATVELVTPVALEVGATFSILEGGKPIGTGTIVSVP